MKSDDQVGSFCLPSGIEYLECPINVFKYLNFTNAVKLTDLTLNYPDSETPNIKGDDPAWEGLPKSLTTLELHIEGDLHETEDRHQSEAHFPLFEVMINDTITKLELVLSGMVPGLLFVSTTPNDTFRYENLKNKNEVHVPLQGAYGIVNNVNERIDFIVREQYGLFSKSANLPFIKRDYENAFVLLLENENRNICCDSESDSDADADADADGGDSDILRKMHSFLGADVADLAAYLIEHKSDIDEDGYADELDSIRW
ncbi:unnamed protein product [Ambrosiozyma monospora]|uniref:Unnamed protein product n=1 Tax=Ambrosiozyma monospora TaxID=43982 RepID=A0ACB5TXC7_AMBMO|nr:unnamed protein product [Ambrosiozyma monospora]